jgi:uncharacterized damage-inducible protein DinB
MKSYFLRLFDYDRYANALIANLINKTGNPEAAVKLMAHLLAAQQMWYNRCNSLPTANVMLWPEGDQGTFTRIIEERSGLWRDFLNKLEDADFEKQIEYKNTKGEAFTNKLVDILGHVINHGTHHRAQIGQHLKLAGTDLPGIDYIVYLRSLNS